MRLGQIIFNSATDLLPTGETPFPCFSWRDDVPHLNSEGRHCIVIDIHLALKRDIAPDVADVECAASSVKNIARYTSARVGKAIHATGISVNLSYLGQCFRLAKLHDTTPRR